MGAARGDLKIVTCRHEEKTIKTTELNSGNKYV